MRVLLCLLVLIIGASTAYAEQTTMLCDKAKEVIGKQLLDPDLAQFQCASKTINHGPHKIILVKVNAKSTLWGYTGFERWIVVFLADGSYQVLPPGDINGRLRIIQ